MKTLSRGHYCNKKGCHKEVTTEFYDKDQDHWSTNLYFCTQHAEEYRWEEQTGQPASDMPDLGGVEYKDTKINQGGLMRCCIKTIEDFCEEHLDQEVEDQVLNCKYEPIGNERIKLIGTTWRWNK
jgi:hypothetical protein